MLPSVRAFLRTPFFWAATSGLGLAYLGGALVVAPTGQVLNSSWLGRFDFGPSLLLGVVVRYGGAWLFWRGSGRQPPRRAGWRGAAYGVLAPLAIIVLVGGYDAAEEALHFVPFPGTTAVAVYQRLAEACYDYLGKLLAYLLPLGSLLTGPLGWWAGRRAAASCISPATSQA